MLTVMAIVGIILIIISFVALLYHPRRDVAGNLPVPRWYFSMAERRGTIFIVGLILLSLSGSFFYARPGYQYYLISPFGTKSVVFTQGYKFKVPFTRIQEWEKYVDVKVVTDDEPSEGITGIIHGGIPIRFIDQVTALVDVSVRMQMPQDATTFISLAEEFRHPQNLINNTLVPTVREQVINTGYMFAAQDYISGGASDFRATLDEQLKNGGYSVERKEFYDTIFADIQIEGSQRVIKDIKTRYEVTKRKDGNGVFVRIPHDITKNNILVTQAIIDQVELEQAFKTRLEAQRDISAQKRIELEKIETAKAEQQRIVAEGERDKAQERVTQEKDQVKKLIAIETRLKEEETNKKLAAIQLQTERLKAQALRVQKDAEAYANQRLVQAGLTPQERAEWDYKIATGVAEKLAGPDGIKFPSTYLSGGGSTSQNDALQQIMTLMLAQQMKTPDGN